MHGFPYPIIYLEHTVCTTGGCRWFNWSCAALVHRCTTTNCTHKTLPYLQARRLVWHGTITLSCSWFSHGQRVEMATGTVIAPKLPRENKLLLYKQREHVARKSSPELIITPSSCLDIISLTKMSSWIHYLVDNWGWSWL